MPSASAIRIKSFRESLGLTQRAFAVEIGSSPGTVGNNESSDKDPAKPFLDKIVKRYGVSRDWVLTGQGSPIPEKPSVDPAFEQAQKLVSQFQEMLPDNYRELVTRATAIDAIPEFTPDRSMAAVDEHPAVAPIGGGGLLQISQLALPRSWLYKQKITAPALVPVTNDDMIPTFAKGDVLLIDCTDTEIDDSTEPMAIVLDDKLTVRRLKPIEDRVILTADRPGTMVHEIRLENGSGVGLEILGRVKAAIKTI